MSNEGEQVVAIARIVIDLDREEEALAALAAVADATHRLDRGCALYAVTRDRADPARITIIEKWESLGDLEAHRRAPHSEAFRRALGIIGIDGVSVMSAMGFGDPAKGLM